MSTNEDRGQPGLQYPTDLHKDSVPVQKSVRMIIDNLYFLHRQVKQLVAAGVPASTAQQVINQTVNQTFSGGGGGGGGGGSTVVRVGTHNTRIVSYSAASDPVGSIYFETDRSAIYYITDAFGPPLWEFAAGLMVDVVGNIPGDLAAHDVGFIFFASDISAIYVWDGTAWSYGLMSDHNHTNAAGDGGVLTDDQHDGFSNYAGISTPATPAAGNCRIYSKTANGHTQMYLVDQDGTEFEMLRDNILLIRNTSGVTLNKGTAVDVFGATGQIGNVRKAQASDPTKHCEGLLAEQIANNGFGLMIVQGYVTNMDTSAFADGDILYLSDTAGTYSTTPGTFIQAIGVVIYSHATQGIIYVFHDTMTIPNTSANVALTNQAAAIGSTNLANSGNVGTYRVSYYLETTTADAAAGTIQLTIAFSDGAGATTKTSTALALATLGRDSGIFFVQLASGSIAYSTALVGIIGTAKYALYICLERLT